MFATESILAEVISVDGAEHGKAEKCKKASCMHVLARPRQKNDFSCEVAILIGLEAGAMLIIPDCEWSMIIEAYLHCG